MLFFFCIAIYLYGDLAIYGAAIAKTIRDASCTHFPANYSCNATLPGDVPCWEDMSFSRDAAYRTFLVTNINVTQIVFLQECIFS